MVEHIQPESMREWGITKKAKGYVVSGKIEYGGMYSVVVIRGLRSGVVHNYRHL